MKCTHAGARDYAIAENTGLRTKLDEIGTQIWWGKKGPLEKKNVGTEIISPVFITAGEYLIIVIIR